MPKEKKPKAVKGAKKDEAVGSPVDEGPKVATPPVNSEKEELLALYQKLKDLGINSISDLEVKISRL